MIFNDLHNGDQLYCLDVVNGNFHLEMETVVEISSLEYVDNLVDILLKSGLRIVADRNKERYVGRDGDWYIFTTKEGAEAYLENKREQINFIIKQLK